ncbi:MAG: LysR family transcriptional regulator [Rhodobacterales bacterium]|nr:LysR family transcriptional regulator [Rhodobacterales bacterium]
MEDWNEIRTAFHVVKFGTVSAAAEALGVHHATVIRHIDTLEGRLGVKLFQRHARGYTATEAGTDLLQVAQATDEQFSQIEGRIKGRGNAVSGELVITSLDALSRRMVPVLARFQELYPEISLRYLTDERLFRLEYGEAHVAVRAGAPPEQPDNIVQVFSTQKIGLYASKAYLGRFGIPKSEKDLANHRFVRSDQPNLRAGFSRWMAENVPADRIMFRSNDVNSLEQAIVSGIGIGFLTEFFAQGNQDLVKVCASKPDWAAPLWLVTHMDIHRTIKVQTFLTFLKEQAKNWETS